MPRVPLDRPATYEDLIQLPEHVVGEIVEGELYASPRPAPRHARAQTRLVAILDGPFDQGRGGPGGWIILYEPELHLENNVVVPDVAGWRRERMPQLPSTAYFDLAPDWLCEVVSPSTASLDRLKKLRIYARERVTYVWLIDPLVQTLEVLRLDERGWTVLATYGGTEIVRAEPFEGIALDLELLWPPSEAPAQER